MSTGRDEIDSQILVENVSFLDCFSNSFNFKTSLAEIKEYVSQEKELRKINLSSTNKTKTNSLDCTSYNANILTQYEVSDTEKDEEKKEDFKRLLKNWGLPHEIVNKYAQKGIQEMFQWQVECLSNPKVLLNCSNLVYSAPTSAGKTLVAEILSIKTILERQKKVIVILPFVSIVREKMFYLQNILSSSGIRVEGFMGSQSPPGGLQAVHMAICTIEKANSLVNKLLDENSISDLGAIIVDELHLLGDPHRGYILELLLTKVKYITSNVDDVQIQIIGMSATLPNLEVLSNWLDAELYITDFRPIPLDEFCLVGNNYYDKNGKPTKNIKLTDSEDGDHVLSICLDTIKEGCSILIFCMTKNRCENLAQNIASSFFNLGCVGNELGTVLRNQLKSNHIAEVLEQLKSCPVGLDHVLKNVISFGVAYHHAGLTFDERDIIEGAFKSGAIRVLVATSTLSSGVNLPARKVVIRSPVFQRQPINILTYKQMVGRAGRMGKDSKGESILICASKEKKIGFDLMMGNLDPVKSCIESEDKFMRAVIEMIASQVVCTKAELEHYSKCTLLFHQANHTSQNSLLENTLKQLIDFELVRVQTDSNENRYVATSLGKACLSSSMAPNDGLSLFCELQKARQCIVLETDLHLIYLVTPYSVSSQWAELDWLHLLSLWESLTLAMKRVGVLVGVQESFIIRCLRGKSKSACKNKLDIHKRFYTALALQDLVNEVPLSVVATKFHCARGFLQGLQQAAATFAGMVTAFCRQLGWKNMELLISQFQDRLHFGVHSELLDLMKLSSLNGVRARTLFNAGFETISSIASADVNAIENALYKAVPFQSEKGREGDDIADIRKRNQIRNIWITGFCGMTAREAAENLIEEARKYVEQDIGVGEIKWDNKPTLPTEDLNNTNMHIKQEPTIENDSPVLICTRETVAIAEIRQNSQAFENDTDNEVVTINKMDECIRSVEEEVLLKPILSVAEVCPRDEEKDNSSTNNHSFKIKEEILWDTLNINETVLNNISKIRQTVKVSSPNISFGEFDQNTDSHETSRDNKSHNTSIKDVSLFSSEGDNLSLFEESFSIDQTTNTLLETKTKIKSENITGNSEITNINSSSILEAFETSVIEEDEDKMTLIYDEDSEDSKDIKKEIINNNVLEEVDEISTQEVTQSWVKKDFISPLKRTKKSSHKMGQPQAKKKKVSKSSSLLKSSLNTKLFKLNNKESKGFVMQINDKCLDCYVLRGADIIDSIDVFHKLEIACCMIVRRPTETRCSIGTNILKGKSSVSNNEPSTNALSNSPIKLIAFYFKSTYCIILDLLSLESLNKFTSKLSNFLMKSVPKIRCISVKTHYLHLMKLLECDLKNVFSDVLVLEWLMHNEEGSPSVRDLAKKYCDIDMLSTKISVNEMKKNYTELDEFEDSCLQVWTVFNIAQEQEKCLLDKYQFALSITDLENQVLKILAYSEYQGIRVDKELASRLLADVRSSQETLQKRAYRICGYNFNFNSSKDVAKALGLYKGRKVSTKKSVLSAQNTPLADIVMYWRKLNSILTKTLYPLTEKAYLYSSEDKINPSYTMFTCTGRISMHEPNLQNVPRTFSIPMKYLKLTDSEPSDEVAEFNCRNVFKASQGSVFVSADYCQLEMRILTHYSEDAVLTRIMKSNVDVFKSIAASWGGVPENSVDDDLRQKAKQLCYGIFYGMGDRTLSQHLEVSEMEAAVFMDSFYKTYPEVKAFTQRVVEDCRSKGYVETLMKRRRYLPDINSPVVAKKSAAERQAINTTIQGSAADIAKAAMCAIDNRSTVHKPHLVLQMHDELIYEVKEHQKNDFIKILKNVMETTVSLNVPLPVKVKAGNTWGSLEEIKM